MWTEYGKDKEQWKRRQREWKENNARTYHLVLLHCSRFLKAEFMNHSKWVKGQQDQDCILFLLMIRDLTHGMKETKQGTMALVDVTVDLFTTIQGKKQSLDDYYKIFIARRDTVDAHGGDAGFHQKLFKNERAKIMLEKGRDETWMASAHANVTQLAEKDAIETRAKKICCDQFLAALFIKMSDKERYGVLKDKFNNVFVLGDDKAPKTVVDAKRVLADFSVTAAPNRSAKTEETEGTGLTFVEAAAERNLLIAIYLVISTMTMDPQKKRSWLYLSVGKYVIEMTLLN